MELARQQLLVVQQDGVWLSVVTGLHGWVLLLLIARQVSPVTRSSLYVCDVI